MQDIFVIHNVGKEKMVILGLHLKVVMVDVVRLYSFSCELPSIWYYGDSLGWQFQSNIDRLVKILTTINPNNVWPHNNVA